MHLKIEFKSHRIRLLSFVLLGKNQRPNRINQLNQLIGISGTHTLVTSQRTLIYE